MTTYVAAGSEFNVNSTFARTQAQADGVQLADGRSIVTWIDADYNEMIECPKCSAFYRASYRIVLTPAEGSFHCHQCQTEVRRWRGVRDYCEWTPAI